MGQKVNPIANRIPFLRDWNSKWFSHMKNFPDLLEEDWKIRYYIKQKMPYTGISKVVIERTGDNIKIAIHTARPGIIIGRRGQDVENLRFDIEQMTKKKVLPIDIIEVKFPELDAQLVAEGVALQIEKRVNHRRAMHQAIEKVIAAGAKGVKIMVSGRLGGAEIARFEWLKQGRIPTSIFRADVDFGKAEALIKQGKIGVKVWICRGETIFKESPNQQNNVIS